LVGGGLDTGEKSVRPTQPPELGVYFIKNTTAPITAQYIAKIYNERLLK
jgi:hypothetical protein